MDQIKELQEQIEALKKTVNEPYLKELDSKGIQYSVIKREMSMLRIRKQYNKNTLLRKG